MCLKRIALEGPGLGRPQVRPGPPDSRTGAGAGPGRAREDHPIIWATTLVIRYIRYIEFWDPSGPGPIPNMNYIGFNIDNKNGPGPKWARAQVGPGPKRARAQVGPGPKWTRGPSQSDMDMDISGLGFHEISGRKRERSDRFIDGTAV